MFYKLFLLAVKDMYIIVLPYHYYYSKIKKTIYRILSSSCGKVDA